MYAVKGIFDGKTVTATDPIPMQCKCDVVITFLDYPVNRKREIKNIMPKSFSVKERMSILENLVGIVHHENPDDAEKIAKEERLARQ
jgi:hypothetical protein